MKTTTTGLLDKAKSQMAQDMKARELGAVIWDNASAGFHFIPELIINDPKTGKPRTVRVTGLYLFEDNVYAIEEDTGINVRHFYTPGIDVPPTVVTLSPSKADEEFGMPTQEKGFTIEGSLEQWVAVADCYFEALAE